MKLRKLSKILGSAAFPGGLDASTLFSQMDKKEEALKELIDICFEDRSLRKIVDEYGATRESLEELYHLLAANGAGQWVDGHFVAASALVFKSSLKTCLEEIKAPNLGLRSLCYILIEYYD